MLDVAEDSTIGVEDEDNVDSSTGVTVVLVGEVLTLLGTEVVTVVDDVVGDEVVPSFGNGLQ